MPDSVPQVDSRDPHLASRPIDSEVLPRITERAARLWPELHHLARLAPGFRFEWEHFWTQWLGIGRRANSQLLIRQTIDRLMRAGADAVRSAAQHRSARSHSIQSALAELGEQLSASQPRFRRPLARLLPILDDDQLGDCVVSLQEKMWPTSREKWRLESLTILPRRSRIAFIRASCALLEVIRARERGDLPSQEADKRVTKLMAPYKGIGTRLGERPEYAAQRLSRTDLAQALQEMFRIADLSRSALADVIGLSPLSSFRDQAEWVESAASLRSQTNAFKAQIRRRDLSQAHIDDWRKAAQAWLYTRVAGYANDPFQIASRVELLRLAGLYSEPRYMNLPESSFGGFYPNVPASRRNTLMSLREFCDYLLVPDQYVFDERGLMTAMLWEMWGRYNPTGYRFLDSTGDLIEVLEPVDGDHLAIDMVTNTWQGLKDRIVKARRIYIPYFQGRLTHDQVHKLYDEGELGLYNPHYDPPLPGEFGDGVEDSDGELEEPT